MGIRDEISIQFLLILGCKLHGCSCSWHAKRNHYGRLQSQQEHIQGTHGWQRPTDEACSIAPICSVQGSFGGNILCQGDLEHNRLPAPSDLRCLTAASDTNRIGIICACCISSCLLAGAARPSQGKPAERSVAEGRQFSCILVRDGTSQSFMLPAIE